MEAKYPKEMPDYVKQLKEWGYPYVIYSGQYDYLFAQGTQEAAMEDELNRLWSGTLPELLLADSDEEFDRILDGFRAQREKLGFAQVQQAKTKAMQQAKEKLGIQ